MSYGMPKSYDHWRTQGPPEEDHSKDCPAHEDQEWPIDERGIAIQPDCLCVELANDAKADAAEAQIDRMREEE